MPLSKYQNRWTAHIKMIKKRILITFYFFRNLGMYVSCFASGKKKHSSNKSAHGVPSKTIQSAILFLLCSFILLVRSIRLTSECSWWKFFLISSCAQCKKKLTNGSRCKNKMPLKKTHRFNRFNVPQGPSRTSRDPSYHPTLSLTRDDVAASSQPCLFHSRAKIAGVLILPNLDLFLLKIFSNIA
jgi:hypothetical protein